MLPGTWRHHKFPELKADTAARDPWSALLVIVTENAPRSVAADFLDPSVCRRLTGLLQAAAGFEGASLICMSPSLHPKIWGLSPIFQALTGVRNMQHLCEPKKPLAGRGHHSDEWFRIVGWCCMGDTPGFKSLKLWKAGKPDSSAPQRSEFSKHQQRAETA